MSHDIVLWLETSIFWDLVTSCLVTKKKNTWSSLALSRELYFDYKVCQSKRVRMSPRVAWKVKSRASSLHSRRFFTFFRRTNRTSEQASGRAKERAWGKQKYGDRFFFYPSLSLAPYFSHSLAVLFPSRAFENKRLLRRPSYTMLYLSLRGTIKVICVTGIFY